jgi:hypothetical protein
MRMQHSLIVELDQLVFAAPAHGGHAGASDRATLLRRQLLRERRVVQLERRDPATDEVTAQRDDRSLDFRKFGHVR